MRAVLFIVAVGACTFDRPADVTFGEAAITITEGDGQTGVVDTELPTALKVNVTDADFIPIENFTVEFSVRDANGELSEEAVRTDAQGNARTELKLGARSGEQFVDVSGEGIEGNEPVFFAMTALADVPAQISPYAGDGGSATVATQVGAPLVARVEDRFGNPSPAGREVTFSVATGGGTLATPTGTSSADGTVASLITLGTVAGPSTVEATSPGLATATFTVSGIADVAVSMERFSPATLLAEALGPSEEMIVLARDMYGNPAPGASITFTRTGGSNPPGTITNATVVTDADGRAANTIVAASLGGTNVVTATGTLTGTGIQFTATTRNLRPPTQLSSPGLLAGTVAIGDLNGDAKLDIVVGTQIFSPTSFTGLTIYFNTTAVGASTTTFAAGVQVAASVSSGSRIGIADVTGDAVPDVLVNYSTMYVYPNTTAVGATTPTFGSSFTINASSGRPVLADLNGDQMLDIALLGSQIRACRRTGATTFSGDQYFGNTNTEYQTYLSDVNADGKPDFTAFYSNSIYTYLNTTAAGATSFSFAQTNTSAGGYYGALADLDGDTKPDWFVSSGTSNAQVYRNTTVTTPSFAADPVMTQGLNAPITVIDLNGDGKLDVLGNSGSVARLLLNTSTVGATSFVASDTTVSYSNSTTNYVHVADLNGDGRPDAIVDGGGGSATIIHAQ